MTREQEGLIQMMKNQKGQMMNSDQLIKQIADAMRFNRDEVAIAEYAVNLVLEEAAKTLEFRSYKQRFLAAAAGNIPLLQCEAAAAVREMKKK